MKKYLHLPCLRGVIGDWTYYCSVMKIKDVVKRIITVSESEELYTKNIAKVLQREINTKRIKQIEYYLNNKEHFFSSIVVAIYKGNPIWSDFDIETHFRIEKDLLENDDVKFIENKLGILSLHGDEIIFALDGQHRVKGIKEAYSNNPTIGEEDISLIFIVHNDQNKERTRRLFTVLNKYAQKPKEAELIILDEDDVSAIITRRLLENHDILKHKNAISNTNGANLPSTDMTTFTTLVTVNRINKIILSTHRIDYTKRPNDDEINQYYLECCEFWDYLFRNFPDIKSFITGSKAYFANGDLFNRNKETGGSALLRPIGQKLFAQIYIAFKNNQSIDVLTSKISNVDFNLNGNIFKYITWNEKMLPKSESIQKRILFYILGISDDNNIQMDIKTVYNKYGIEYDNNIKPI
ncbi:MAG: DGQHR domain-containing protein [Alphaproteobacteria bacterium]|nr:DGQHR domain-containing protein [Alphaproteobacteria bacterium]